MQQRNQWIDIAKGIGILLVVIGHSSIPIFMSNFIWAFHMPLFFICSGWVTSWGKYSVGEFVANKVRTLLIPFIIYSSIVLLVKEIIGIGDLYLWLRKGWQGYALWFVPVLFFASIIVRIINAAGKQYVLLGGILCLILGAFLSYFKISLPWTISSIPYAVFLIILGSVLNKYAKFIATPKWYILVCCAIITFTISSLWRLDMAFNNILPVIPLTCGAISGTFMIFFTSSYIYNNTKILSNILQAIGRETFIILAFSQIISMTLIECTSLGVIARYVIDFSLLIALKYLKDFVNHLVGRKLL